jgi:hypothetical protein
MHLNCEVLKANYSTSQFRENGNKSGITVELYIKTPYSGISTTTNISMSLEIMVLLVGNSKPGMMWCEG